ncbi:Metalloenzyme, LuxS/M16 peptidase-like protein [Zopfochytrium polystomum]|nr:Metalloenzyme, LuxS/M16 peptidase-like protein [Zopfochytrium polystomum]
MKLSASTTARSRALLSRSASVRTAAAAGSRAYAVETSAVNYARKGDQPAAAPAAIKAVSTSAKGVKIATLDSRGPVSSLSLVIGAGSRHESATAPGVAHFLKNTLVRTVPGDNIVRTIREIELRGDSLQTSVGREQISIGSHFLRDDLVDIVPLLFSHVFNPSFQPYEFLDAIPKILAESTAALSDPSVKVVDALHAVAFRHGLGNSIFATAGAAKSLKRADLQSFAAQNFSTDKIAIVGTGVAHNELAALVDETIANLTIASSSATVAPSQYYGGETRIEAGPGGSSHYAVAFKSVAYGAPEYAASLVLSSLLGGSPSLKWGSVSGASSLLSSAATGKTSVSAFTANYTDAGLVGFYVTGNAAEVKSVAQKSIDALKSVATSGASAEALARAKKAAIVDAESKIFSNRDETISEVAKRVIAAGSYHTSSELAVAISSVTAEDVAKVAKLAVGSKPSVVAYGNLRVLPFADEL